MAAHIDGPRFLNSRVRTTREEAMAMEDYASTESSQRTQREGSVARGIEKQTSKLPSDLFLWAGLGAAATSLGLQLAGKPKAGNFVATWVPTVLLFGVYNKLVKLGGHDRYDRRLD
jgi:hypothetical protein